MEETDFMAFTLDRTLHQALSKVLWQLCPVQPRVEVMGGVVAIVKRTLVAGKLDTAI